VIVLVTAVFRQIIRGFPSRRPVRRLDHYEVAFLAGGKQRVAEVIIAELVDRGALRVDSRGRITEADPSARTGPYAEAAGLIPPSGMMTSSLRGRICGYPGLKDLAPRLRFDGLLIPTGRLIAMRCLTGAMLVALLVTGIERMIEGHDNHRPITDLVGLIAVSILLGLWLVSSTFKPPMTTRFGRWYLRTLRKSPAAAGVPLSGVGVPGTQFPLQTVPALATAAVLGVALWGFTAVPDTGIRAALIAGLPSSSGGTSCSGGGSCGGGGCGGGGCGGGGGGCGG
jgi:uncharacterized protein (TIGR04222 family)